MDLVSLDNIRGTAQCMRESGCNYAMQRVLELVQAFLSENEEAAGFVEHIENAGDHIEGFFQQIGDFFDSVGDHLQWRIADVHAKCPTQAWECGFPSPDTDLMAIASDLGDIQNSMECMREAGCNYAMQRVVELMQNFLSQNEGGGEAGGWLDHVTNVVDQVGDTLDQAGDHIGGWLDQAGDHVGGWLNQANDHVGGLFQQLGGGGGGMVWGQPQQHYAVAPIGNAGSESIM